MNANPNRNMTIIEQWFRRIFTAQNVGIILAFISAFVAVITLLIEHGEELQLTQPQTTTQQTAVSAPAAAPSTVQAAPAAQTAPAAPASPKEISPAPAAAPATPPKTAPAAPKAASPSSAPAAAAVQTKKPEIPLNIEYSFNNPDVHFSVKKCVCSGGSAYIDLVITNNSGSNMSASVLSQEPCAGYESWKCVAYDDAGNSYSFSRLKAGGSDRAIGSNYPLELPDGVPVKARIWISGVASDASAFAQLRMTFRGMDTGEPYGAALLQMKNIPITRP